MIFLNILCKISSKFLYFIYQSIDEDSLKLHNKISAKFATENFNKFLAFYGLNHKSFSNAKDKCKSRFLLVIFCLTLLKVIIISHLDPVKDYQWCICLGDFTLLFKSLRKYLIVIWILLCTFGISLNCLFNYDSSTYWFELFKCFDGTLTPKSIGIKDKKILDKILILTKFSFKSVKKIDFYFNLASICFCLYLILRKTRVYDGFEIISFVIWFPTTICIIYFFGGTILTSNYCFNITCIYCLISIKYFNQFIDKYETQLTFGWKRYVMRLKLKLLLKQQNEFAIRILKYNKFWSKIYMINMLHFIPGHIIILQQILFGHLNMELRFIYIMTCFFATLFIISSPLITSLIDKEMKTYCKKLLKLQFKPHLNFDINTKLKVNQIYIFKII